MTDRYSYSSAPVRKVKTIQFGTLDPDFVVSPGRPLNSEGGAGQPAQALRWAVGRLALAGLFWRSAVAQRGGVSERPRPASAAGRGRGRGWLRAYRRRPWACRSNCPPQRRYSVAKIETSQTYEKGRPKLGGLSDPRMGTMDRAVKCMTDGARCGCLAGLPPPRRLPGPRLPAGPDLLGLAL